MLMQNVGAGGGGGIQGVLWEKWEVQMANKENIRICIGGKMCNFHGKSKNVIIILFLMNITNL